MSKEPKVIIWDLECTNLKADWGYLLSFGYKYLGEKTTRCLNIWDFPEFKKDPINDKPLVQEAYRILSEADCWVTWFGKMFDTKFLQTRGMKHGIGPLPPVAHVDGCMVSRSHLKLSRNTLDNVSRFFKISKKTPVGGETWQRAIAGHAPSRNYIVDHCKKDVVVTEEAYMILRPLLANHPAIYKLKTLEKYQKPLIPDRCQTCGAVESFEMRGERVAEDRVFKKIVCKCCQKWQSIPLRPLRKAA